MKLFDLEIFMVIFVFFKRAASDKCISLVSSESFNISTLHSIIIYIRQAHNTGFIHMHNDIQVHLNKLEYRGKVHSFQ